MGYTSISVKESSKRKLDLIKKDNESYESVINRLISNMEGAVTEDAVEITREKIAFNLEFNSLSNTGDVVDVVERCVSFAELFQSNVGDIFKPDRKNGVEYFICESGVVVFRDDFTCLVRVATEIKTSTDHYWEFNLLHIHFF